MIRGLAIEFIEFLLFPYTLTFYILTRTRRFLWSNWLKQTKLNCRVVSIGNLTTGGTGKTTLVMDLLRVAKKKKMKAAVVSRSYKAQQSEAARVDIQNAHGALQYGDEAFLIAKEFPEFPVYVGRSKTVAALLCEKIEKPDIVFVDDGFQHMRLYRNVDIVIIDASAPVWHYLYLPFGRLREAMTALYSASTIVVSKMRFSQSKWRPWSKYLVRLNNVLLMDYSAGELVDVQSSQRRLVNTLKGDRVLLVSGIGGPNVFKKMVQMDLSVDIKNHLKFPDHHNYSDEDVKNIDANFEKLGCDLVLTTAKDAVKLKGRLKSPIFYVELQKDLKNLEEQLSRVVFG